MSSSRLTGVTSGANYANAGPTVPTGVAPRAGAYPVGGVPYYPPTAGGAYAPPGPYPAGEYFGAQINKKIHCKFY